MWLSFLVPLIASDLDRNPSYIPPIYWVLYCNLLPDQVTMMPSLIQWAQSFISVWLCTDQGGTCQSSRKSDVRYHKEIHLWGLNHRYSRYDEDVCRRIRKNWLLIFVQAGQASAWQAHHNFWTVCWRSCLKMARWGLNSVNCNKCIRAWAWSWTVVDCSCDRLPACIGLQRRKPTLYRLEISWIITLRSLSADLFYICTLCNDWTAWGMLTPSHCYHEFFHADFAGKVAVRSSLKALNLHTGHE